MASNLLPYRGLALEAAQTVLVDPTPKGPSTQSLGPLQEDIQGYIGVYRDIWGQKGPKRCI